MADFFWSGTGAPEQLFVIPGLPFGNVQQDSWNSLVPGPFALPTDPTAYMQGVADRLPVLPTDPLTEFVWDPLYRGFAEMLGITPAPMRPWLPQEEPEGATDVDAEVLANSIAEMMRQEAEERSRGLAIDLGAAPVIPMPPELLAPPGADYSAVREMMALARPEGYDESRWEDDRLMAVLSGLAQGALLPAANNGQLLLNLGAGGLAGWGEAWAERRQQETAAEAALRDYYLRLAGMEADIAEGTARETAALTDVANANAMAQWETEVENLAAQAPEFHGIEGGMAVMSKTVDGRRVLTMQPIAAVDAINRAAELGVDPMALAGSAGEFGPYIAVASSLLSRDDLLGNAEVMQWMGPLIAQSEAGFAQNYLGVTFDEEGFPDETLAADLYNNEFGRAEMQRRLTMSVATYLANNPDQFVATARALGF